jgi:hydrogenase-4 membrane subunit HyfE
MIVDFTAQIGPFLWAILAALLILALVLFSCIEPELAEVYLGDAQLLVATLALAAIALVMLVSGRAETPHAFGFLVPGR